ncbi:MAG TPA: FAD-dependent oxidoreductase, partial [Bryobacteraceae bacterium]|nr:FAD-dependent oxidoreductase [Bryobacteraceae bacterium]
GQPIDYRECGAFEIARDDHEAGELEKRAVCQSALGIRSEPARWASAAAARFYPDDALVNPRDMVAALRVACSANGVIFHEREPVVEVFADGVRTARATYTDDSVLLAAGAWSSALATPFHLPAVSSVRGHLISYEAAPGLLPAILRCGSTYLLQRENGTIVAGSSTEHVGFDRTIDERIVQEIHVRALNLFPELPAAGPTDRWIGFRPAIEGEIPAVGRIEGTAVWTAFGHYRNGILLAPETARRIEKSVAG